MTFHDARVLALREIPDHAWLGRLWKRLKNEDMDLIIRFVEDRCQQDFATFEMGVNRMFLDLGDAKPKRWKEISEILCCVNSQGRSSFSEARAEGIVQQISSLSRTNV